MEQWGREKKQGEAGSLLGWAVAWSVGRSVGGGVGKKKKEIGGGREKGEKSNLAILLRTHALYLEGEVVVGRPKEGGRESQK